LNASERAVIKLLAAVKCHLASPFAERVMDAISDGNGAFRQPGATPEASRLHTRQSAGALANVGKQDLQCGLYNFFIGQAEISARGPIKSPYYVSQAPAKAEMEII